MRLSAVQISGLVDLSALAVNTITVVQLVFIVLKMVSIIDWSWWVVMSPLITVAVATAVTIGCIMLFLPVPERMND